MLKNFESLYWLIPIMRYPHHHTSSDQQSATRPEEYHFIVPAFFRLIQYLQQEKAKFSIIFRTFGSDIPDVIKALNAYCSGGHPLFPNLRFDGQEGTSDLRVRNLDYLADCQQVTWPKACGVFHRIGITSSETSLIMGTTEKANVNHTLDFYKSHQNLEIFTSFFHIYDGIHKYLNQYNVLAIQDHWEW